MPDQWNQLAALKNTHRYVVTHFCHTFQILLRPAGRRAFADRLALMVAAAAALGALLPCSRGQHACCEAGVQRVACVWSFQAAESRSEVERTSTSCIVSGAREGCVELEHFL